MWLYCIGSSFGGHVGFYIFINIPNLDWYKFTSYESMWLKSLLMEICVKIRENKHQSIEFFLISILKFVLFIMLQSKFHAFHVIAYTQKCRNRHQNQISMSNIVKVLKLLQIALMLTAILAAILDFSNCSRMRTSHPPGYHYGHPIDE